MKYLKIFEEFTKFQLDEITRSEFMEYHRVKETELKPSGEYPSEILFDKSKLLKIKSLLPKNYHFAYGSTWFTIEYFYESEYNEGVFKKIAVDKVRQEDDEPFYTLQFFYEISKGDKVNDQYKFYRFEESDFEEICDNPQVLLDYLDKNIMTNEPPKNI